MKRLVGLFLALTVVGVLTVPVAAMPPQDTQDVAFSPNPVPIEQDCFDANGNLVTTALTITGTKWAGHYKQHDPFIIVQYSDGSQRFFGTVTLDGSGNWQTTITVDCGMPYLVNGALIIHVVLFVHDTSWKDGTWDYFIPVVWT